MSQSQEQVVAAACDEFVAAFGRRASAGARAPGRVNLLGDHVDYCAGLVLPVALQLSTVAVGGLNGTTTCNVISLSEKGSEARVSFQAPSPQSPLSPGQPAWANYVKGVVANFPGEVKGFDAVISSNVPIGGGVSSSAALEVAVFTLLEALTGVTVDIKKKVLACQKAENEYAGMPCGIMDQYVATAAKRHNALLIDCRSLEATHIPLLSEDVVILVTNSNVKHQLTGSEYPLRRQQCQQAANILGIKTLRDASVEDLEELKGANADADVLKRAEHVIREIARTELAAKCLQAGDFTRVGELFYESHESMAKLMETSCPELDRLVEIARAARGVLGSRMTGGGFGGCTVTLVQKEHLQDLIETIRSRFEGSPEFFVCKASDGAHILDL